MVQQQNAVGELLHSRQPLADLVCKRACDLVIIYSRCLVLHAVLLSIQIVVPNDVIPCGIHSPSGYGKPRHAENGGAPCAEEIHFRDGSQVYMEAGCGSVD